MHDLDFASKQNVWVLTLRPGCRLMDVFAQQIVQLLVDLLLPLVLDVAVDGRRLLHDLLPGRTGYHGPLLGWLVLVLVHDLIQHIFGQALPSLGLIWKRLFNEALSLDRPTLGG